MLAYKLVGPTAVLSITGTADGDAHSVTVAAATSAAYVAGRYSVHEYVSRSAERFTLATGVLTVLANLAAATTGADLRSHAEKMLAAIEAWLERKAPTSASIEIAGRKISNYPLPELLALRDRYRAEVARERQIANGGTPSRLLLRF